jgi:uncharacterized membrane protein
MKKILALRIVLIIAISGMLFSGYLSYGEVIAKSCPVGGCSNLFGIPVCLYGFIMYTGVFVISLLGIRSKK